MTTTRILPGMTFSKVAEGWSWAVLEAMGMDVEGTFGEESVFYEHPDHRTRNVGGMNYLIVQRRVVTLVYDKENVGVWKLDWVWDQRISQIAKKFRAALDKHLALKYRDASESGSGLISKEGMTMLPLEEFQARTAASDARIVHAEPFDDVPGSEIIIRGLPQHLADDLEDEVDLILPDEMSATFDTERGGQTTITIEEERDSFSTDRADDLAWWRVEHRKLVQKLKSLIQKVEGRSERETSQEVKKLLAKVRKQFEKWPDLDMDDPDDFRIYRNYSGRGMYGDVSPLAFVTPVRPTMALGRKLQQMGFSYDSMGMDIIYYIRGPI